MKPTQDLPSSPSLTCPISHHCVLVSLYFEHLKLHSELFTLHSSAQLCLTQLLSEILISKPPTASITPSAHTSILQDKIGGYCKYPRWYSGSRVYLNIRTIERVSEVCSAPIHAHPSAVVILPNKTLFKFLSWEVRMNLVVLMYRKR